MELNQELGSILEKNFESLGEAWISLLNNKMPVLQEFFLKEDLKKSTQNFQVLLLTGLKSNAKEPEDEAFLSMRNSLVELSHELSAKNFTSSEAVLFVLYFKEVLTPFLIEAYSKDLKKLTDSILFVNKLIDHFAMITMEAYLENKERVIREQASTILEMSTPVVKIWNRIILLPLVGVLDSTRAKQMMESLLGSIESHQAKVAIIDISGIPVIDTLVARHLFTTIAAVKLMGSECIITGISSRISQTIVHLGLDLSGILTRASLEDGLQLALAKIAQNVD